MKNFFILTNGVCKLWSRYKRKSNIYHDYDYNEGNMGSDEESEDSWDTLQVAQLWKGSCLIFVGICSTVWYTKEKDNQNQNNKIPLYLPTAVHMPNILPISFEQFSSLCYMYKVCGNKHN